jgi:hypothetical protein
MKTLIVGIIVLCIVAYLANKIVKEKMKDWS